MQNALEKRPDFLQKLPAGVKNSDTSDMGESRIAAVFKVVASDAVERRNLYRFSSDEYRQSDATVSDNPGYSG